MVIAGVGLRLARVHRRVAIPVIVGLFDAGEFTLILAQEGWRRGLVEVRYLSILTGVVVLSMLMLPLLSIFENIFEKFLGFLGWGKETKMFGLGNGEEVFAGGVIVFGGGRTGRLVCEWLKQKHRKAVVVDYDLRVIERLVEKGVRAVYGNAVDEETIDFLNIDRAKGVVVTVPEGRVTAEIIKKVRSRNNKVNLVVRAHSRNEATWFKELGANRVILAEESVGRLMCSYLKLGR
jgi:CPA2 family monovalent cation:H+ antiporter-2